MTTLPIRPQTALVEMAMTDPTRPPDHDVDTDDGPRLPPAAGTGTAPPGAHDPSAPFLPSSTPAAPAPPDSVNGGGDPAPFLPAAAPVAPAPAAQPVVFDAKAMVDSQKRVNPNPAYGPLPKGSNEGREAARQLREQANRKRRRSRAVSRIVGVVVLAGVAAGAYVGYRVYQESQDDDDVAVDDGDAGTDTDGDTPAEGGPAGDDAATDDDAPAPRAGAGLTPLGVIAEQLEAQETLNDAAPGGIVGAMVDAMDDARSVVDDINERSQGATDVADEITDEGSAGAVGTSAIDVVVTRFDLSTADELVVQSFVADVERDTYFVATTLGGGDVLAAVETDPQYHYQYTEGGEFARAERSEASLADAPDALFVTPIAPQVVFPVEAVLHSTAIDIALGTPDADLALDDSYVVDVESFAATFPDVAATWLALLQAADPTAQPSIVGGTVEVLTDVPADDLAIAASEAAGDMAWPDPYDRTAVVAPTAGQAVVGWSLADNGLVDTLYVHLGDGSAHWLYEVVDFAPLPFIGGVLAPG